MNNEERIIAYLQNTIKDRKRDNEWRIKSIKIESRKKDIPLSSISNTLANIESEKEVIYNLEHVLKVCKAIIHEKQKLESEHHD